MSSIPEKINITNAKYRNHPDTGEVFQIKAEIDGKMHWVPMEEGNRHYKEIMRQVDAGELTIEDAD